MTNITVMIKLEQDAPVKIEIVTYAEGNVDEALSECLQHAERQALAAAHSTRDVGAMA